LNCQVSSPVNPNKDIFDYVPEVGYDWLTFESLMYQFWKPDSVVRERKRIRQTWFDYRHIHPVLRSFVFLKEYERAYQRAYKRYYGTPSRPGKDLPSTKSLYRRKPTAIRLIILKMHLIDELGCPYDTYFNAAIDHMMQERGFETTFKDAAPHLRNLALPPLNMLCDARALVSGQKAFEERNSYKMRLPKLPHYRAENWHGTSEQKACAKWLIKTANTKPGRDTVLARLAYEAGLIRENEVVKHLSLSVVKNMRAIKSTL